MITPEQRKKLEEWAINEVGGTTESGHLTPTQIEQIEFLIAGAEALARIQSTPKEGDITPAEGGSDEESYSCIPAKSRFTTNVTIGKISRGKPLPMPESVSTETQSDDEAAREEGRMNHHDFPTGIPPFGIGVTLGQRVCRKCLVNEKDMTGPQGAPCPGPSKETMNTLAKFIAERRSMRHKLLCHVLTICVMSGCTGSAVAPHETPKTWADAYTDFCRQGVLWAELEAAAKKRNKPYSAINECAVMSKKLYDGLSKGAP